MSYIDPSWITKDLHGSHLYDAGQWAKVADTVDSKLNLDCARRGITIPVDGDGYIDSDALQSVAIDLAFWYLFASCRGVRDSNTDAHRQLAVDHQQMYLLGVSNLRYTLV